MVILETSAAAAGVAVGSSVIVNPVLVTLVRLTPLVAGIVNLGEPDETLTTIELTELTKLIGVDEEIPKALNVKLLPRHPRALLSISLKTMLPNLNEPPPWLFAKVDSGHNVMPSLSQATARVTPWPNSTCPEPREMFAARVVCTK